MTVVDDYGHHPTEVSVTLSAAADLPFKRIVCVFQPHRYSRTQALAAEFGRAFDSADVLRVMDVFSAGEMPIPGISGKTIVEAVRHRQRGRRRLRAQPQAAHREPLRPRSPRRPAHHAGRG